MVVRDRWMRKPIAGRIVKPLLLEKGSLTRLLQLMASHHHVRFSVKPTQSFKKADAEEARRLALSERRLLLHREVYLMGGQMSWVYASSLIPMSGLRGPWRLLSGIGAKPLGAILFSNPRVQRGAHQYKQLGRFHPVAQKIRQDVTLPQAPLWARRATFTLRHARLSVMEVFLPELVSIR